MLLRKKMRVPKCIWIVFVFDIADTMDKGVRTDAIIIDFSKAFDLVPHDRLLKKLGQSGVDLRVVAWIKEFLLGRSQRVRIDGHLSDDVRVMSGVPQGSVLGPLLLLVYVNDIWRGIDSNIRLFADDCIIYRKILDSSDTAEYRRVIRIEGVSNFYWISDEIVIIAFDRRDIFSISFASFNIFEKLCPATTFILQY